jgi:hypothetical protein
MAGHAIRRCGTAGIGVAALIAVNAAAPTANAVSSARAIAKVASSTNTSFAGYQVSKAKTHIKTASEDFVVPTITCKKNFSGVGPSVLVDSTVNKKTNSYRVSGAGVGVACEHKAPIYQSIIEVDGTTYNDFTLSAGDHATITVTLAKHKASVTLDDATTNAAATHSGKHMTGASASLGCASLSINKRGVGLDPFASIHVKNATVNGKTMKAQKAAKVTWISAKHPTHVLVTASKLSAGKNFDLTFKNSK